MRWFNFPNRFPYSDFHSLNLDWILEEITRLRAEWETVKAEWEQMKIDWQTFQERMQRLWQEYKNLMDAAWAAFQAKMEGEWADYKDEMDAAWEAYKTDLNNQWDTYQNNLNTAWTNYQNALNAWKDGVDDEIDDLQAAWNTYQTTVNNTLNAMQTQIDNFMNDMRSYITQQLPSIAEPLIQDWLDDIDPSSLLLKDLPIVTPEMYGAIGDGVANDTVAWSDCLSAARNDGKMIVCAPRATYLVPSWSSSGDVVILGNQSTIQGNANLLGGNVRGLSISDLKITGYARITGSNMVLKNISCGRIEQIGDVSDILIDGIKITDNNSFGQGVYDFSLSGVTNVIITHVFPYAIGASFYLDEAVRSVIDGVAGPATIKPAGGHTCEWIVSNVGGNITYVAPSDPTGVTIKTPSYTTLQ